MNRILGIVATAVLVLAGVYVLVAPIGPAPGILIGGEPAEAPAQWPDTSGVHEILLKVPGTLPRVVIIWVVEHDDDLYVVGAQDSGWVQMIGSASPVQMNLEGNTYDLTATRLTDGWEPMLEAYVSKYQADYPDIVAGFPAIEDAEGYMALFRLDRG